MQPEPGFEQLKQGMRGTWMSGDFGQIAQYSIKEAEAFVDRLALKSGMLVLDVACGTGNLAIPAARRGAHVTGADIAPNLLEQARKRAAAEHLTAAFDEADAESLPYPDSEFDVVMSMFGAMFAPRPEMATAELLRVCRPGGRIAMANWTPASFAGQMFAMTAKHVPPPPGIPAPVLWGDPAVVRQRFGSAVSHLDMKPRLIQQEFPFPPRQVVALFREYFGPTRMVFGRLDPEGQSAYALALEELWTAHNRSSDGNTSIGNEYLEVVATKA